MYQRNNCRKVNASCRFLVHTRASNMHAHRCSTRSSHTVPLFLYAPPPPLSSCMSPLFLSSRVSPPPSSCMTTPSPPHLSRCISVCPSLSLFLSSVSLSLSLPVCTPLSLPVCCPPPPPRASLFLYAPIFCSCLWHFWYFSNSLSLSLLVLLFDWANACEN